MLPDAPVPDGRTILTNPDVQDIEAVKGHRQHPSRFIRDTNIVDQYVGALRRKLEQPFDGPLIETVRGVGFRLGSEP